MHHIKTINFKKRVINAGMWVTASHAAQQLLRFGSNLVLTRLLFPEAFGLMTIVQTVIIGLTMLSDVGIQPSIVQNKRGGESDFLNTAWSVQVVQGFLIFLSVLLLSPLLAGFYHQPLLTQLLPVAGFGALISGFNSTKLATAVRDLHMGRVALMEMVTYLISLVVTLLLAWIYKSVWALILGTLLGTFLKMLASHFMLPGASNRFALERTSLNVLFSFGGWVFISSALTFIAGEGNKLIVAKLLDVNMLSFYTLASVMSLIFWQTISQLSGKILFPAYAEILRNNPERIYRILIKSRLIIIVPAWLGALFFVFYGDQFMRFLYDERYSESGVILRILAMGTLGGIVGSSYAGILYAKGLVRNSTALLVIQIGLQISAVFLGHYYLGQYGVVIGIALIDWLLYPAAAFVYFKAGVWQPKIDLPILAISLLIVYIASKSILHV